MADKPRLLIFASGSKDGGGSGFKNLVDSSRDGTLEAEIIGVVSNHAAGGVAEKAAALDIPLIHFGGGDAATYQALVAEHQPDFVALSGWLKLVTGLDPRTTFNIHPGPLPAFGGPGLYGHHVHEAVIAAYHRGEVTHSAISMHFVTEKYDEGPVFFQHEVEILPDDTADTLGTRVNQAEHHFQPIVTNAVVQGDISWDGADPTTLTTVDF